MITISYLAFCLIIVGAVVFGGIVGIAVFMAKW